MMVRAVIVAISKRAKTSGVGCNVFDYPDVYLEDRHSGEG